MLPIPPPASSRIEDPKIIGIEIKNENFAIDCFSFPNRIPVDIVEPERDIPGSAAKPWTIPIITASKKFSFFVSFFGGSSVLEPLFSAVLIWGFMLGCVKQGL